MKKYNMPLFILSNSPWPLVISLSLVLLFNNMIIFFSNSMIFVVLLNMILVSLIMFFWWNDVVLESTYSGLHNKYIMSMNIYSMIMFIISEIFFFISFFWSFFHCMFSPDIMIGSNWPYMGIYSINYMNLPLLNSLLLISSGCSVTWSHYMIMNNNLNNSKNSLILTIMLGLFFISLQMFEYIFSPFSFSDGIFGSIFFMSTGFHGFHVMVGTSFLIFMLMRMNKNHFSLNHLMGFEFSIWYWHFVDVVWLYLYLMVYWLGS